MTDTAPAPIRRRSFLSKLFSKKNKHEKAGDGTESHDNAQAQTPASAATTPQDSTQDSKLHKAEEYSQNEEAKSKNQLQKDENSLPTTEGNRAETYVHKAEAAVKKEEEKLEGEWKEAQKPQTAEEKYGDLM